MPEGSHPSTDDARPMDDEGKTTGSLASVILVKLIVKCLLSKGRRVFLCEPDGGLQGCNQVFTQRHTRLDQYRFAMLLSQQIGSADLLY